MRARYAVHLDNITQGARQLLITLAYDQSQMAGPPFRSTIASFEGSTAIARFVLLSSQELPGGLKGT